MAARPTVRTNMAFRIATSTSCWPTGRVTWTARETLSSSTLRHCPSISRYQFSNSPRRKAFACGCCRSVLRRVCSLCRRPRRSLRTSVEQSEFAEDARESFGGRCTSKGLVGPSRSTLYPAASYAATGDPEAEQQLETDHEGAAAAPMLFGAGAVKVCEQGRRICPRVAGQLAVQG